MNNFIYKNPITPIQIPSNYSVGRKEVFGTNFSVLSTGGFMEVFTTSDLSYTILSGQTGIIENTGNTIPINFTKGDGNIFSFDVLTLNSDNISSGRRRLGMLVYVYETNKIYQHTIDNYVDLWTAATSSSGPGGDTVVISDFGSTVKNNTPAGQAFINAWTASTIEGISGYTNLDAAWRVLKTGGGGGASISSFTYNNNTFTITDSTGNTYSALFNVVTGLTINGDLTVTGNTSLQSLTATTISATTYQNLPKDIFVTGGTYSNGTATFRNNSGATFNVSGFFKTSDDIYVTGMTLDSSNYNLTITRNDGTAFTQSLSILSSDVTITGGTYNQSTGVATFTNNTGGTFNVSGFLTGYTDTVITAFTYNNNVFTIKDSSGSEFNSNFNDVTGLTINGDLTVTGKTSLQSLTATTISATTYYNLPSTSGLYLSLSGGTVTGDTIFQSGLTATTISATTYYNLPIDIFVTGGTYYDGEVTFTNNTGGTFTVTGFSTSTTFTGGTVTGSTNFTNGLTANTISATTYYNLPSTSGLYLPLSGGTVTGDTIFQSGLTANTISATTYYNLPQDIFVTGGSYSDGSVIFTNNSGGTFNVSGFYTGTTEIYTTGATYSNNTFTFTNNTGGTYSVLFNTLTGLTINGDLTVTGNTSLQSLTATTISATTYYNLPTDIRTTGGTYSNGTATFTNNTGGTFNVSGFFKTSDDIYVTGMTFNVSNYDLTITRNDGTSFTQSLGALSSDVTITGGTYNQNSGVATFTNNTGGTFNVSGFLTGYTDTVITAFTYNNNTFTIKDSSGSTFNSNFNTLTGLTINGNLTVTGNTSLQGLTAATISATTYQNLPTDVRTTGATYSNNTFTFTNNTGGTYSVLFNTLTGITVNGNLTVTGNTSLQGLTATTISATTYYNLPSTSGAYLPLSGGTMTGGIVANSGVTANTISQTSYIDFTTGSTNPSSVAGRVFFDSISKALSYFDITNNQVPIAMGQQLYTRVWNATGVQIDKGKVIAITGTSNNLPSAILAVNTHGITSARPIGLAAENIPNGSEGLVLNNGILSGITLNTFANGATLYLSDTTPGGYVDSTALLSFTARTNEIGYVLQTGSSIGKIYVNINNEDSNLSLTDKERNILEGNVISTGVYEYTGMTQGAGQTINVAYVRGWVVKNTYAYATLPDVTNIYYTGGTNIALTYLATADATYILINSASTLVQQTTFPTPQERRENIFLGKVVHPNRSTITSINQTVDFDVSPMAALRDLWTPIKLINQGVVVSYYSAGTMNIQTSTGSLWGNGIGWVTNQLNPDSVSISGTSPTTFQYRSRYGSITGSTGLPAAPTGNTTTIDSHHYDLNGSIVAVGGNNRATNQRVYLFPTGVIRIQYGQFSYSNMTNAIAGIDTEVFVEFSNNRDNGILIGILTVREDASDLSITTDAQFRFVSKFGELLGGAGGISTTTLQQAYDNSSNPEIVINSTLDGLSIQNGTGNADNITNLIEGKNTATSTTSFIRADGLISGSSVSAPTISATTISATTYQNLPYTLYTGNGSLSSNRIVDLSTYTLNFSSTTYPNVLFLSGGSVGIGTSTINSSAILDLTSTTKGFLPPRMTESQRTSISSPAIGLIVYQTNNDEGYYIYKSFGWVQII